MLLAPLAACDVAIAPTPSITPSSQPTVVERHLALGPVLDMSLDAKAVYVLYQLPSDVSKSGSGPSSNVIAARLDRNSGAITTRGPFSGATSIARSGDSLWIAAGRFDEIPSSGTLYQVDPASLSIRQKTPLPPISGSQPLTATLAASTTALWLGYGSHLYKIEPSNGTTVATRDIDGSVVSLSVDPAGRTLYVGTNSTSGGAPATVSEWMVGNGDRVASTRSGGSGLGGVHVAATTDGVWIAYATGMQGVAKHLRAADLAETPVPGVPHTNSVRVYVVDKVLWYSDSMARTLTCADPTTGASRAPSISTKGSTIIGDSKGTYLGGLEGVDVLRVDPQCRRQG
jgi:hypothetical protein